MTETDFRRLVSAGEGQHVEFKAAEADAADIARAVVALANSGGGSLLLGVGDRGELWGLWYAQPPHINRAIKTTPDVAAWRQWMVNVSRHNCDPAVPVAAEPVVVAGRDFLVVQVPDGRDKPYRTNGRVYVRIGTDVHDATREEIARLMQDSGRVPYEGLAVPDADLSELGETLLAQYFTEVRRLEYPEDTEERARLLVNMSFAAHSRGRVVPTVAGFLLFGQRPQDRIPSATLKCAFFYGLDQGEQLRDRADIEGPLPKVIDEGAAFVARNRRLVPRMEGIRRVDIPEYPEYTVREAIANAVAHRDWALEGAKVRLFMFDDRLELWSPGKLVPPVTLQRLGDEQFSRNKVIARVLYQLGYMEEVGLGIRRIRRELAELGLPPAEFREEGFSFVITLRSIAPRERVVASTEPEQPAGVGAVADEDPFEALLARGEINARQYQALVFARQHGTIARREYVSLTGASERTATRDLGALVASGLLEVAGGKGWRTTYRPVGDRAS